jgi:uncharacterized protein (DUF302 family)
MPNTLTSLTIDVVRLRFDSDRSFDTVKAALLGRMGRIASDDIAKALASAKTPGDFERAMNAYTGPSGFMLFSEIDHSRYLPLYGVKRRATRLVFGNPAVAATMTQHDVTAALFAPVGLLVYEAEDGEGATVIYDLPSSLMQAQKNPALLAAARALETKMLALVSEATGVTAT